MDNRCEHCSEPINLLRAGARFCSTRCRVADHRAKKSIPDVMRSRRSWVRADGKRPITVSGSPASSTNRQTWASLEEVRQSAAGNGFGFMLGRGIGCYDLDNALHDGKATSKTLELIDGIPEHILFMEISQSGRGLHIFVEAAEGPGTKQPGYERYTRARFIRMTGRAFRI